MKTLFTDSTGLLDSPDALRQRAEEDGFLYFRRLLPEDAVLEVRRDMLEVLDRHGWRHPEVVCLDGRIDLNAISQLPKEEIRDDIGVTHAIYLDVQKLESFHRLPQHPALLSLYGQLFGGEVLVHPRHIARMVSSHPCMAPTPPHQDFPHIQGSENTWTCWIPLGDCPRALGGLSILHGSHRNGYLPVTKARGAGGIATPLCPHETDWREVDYAAGDIVTFPAFTMHKALRCQHKEQIRLSMDLRYQPAAEKVEERSLLPHCDADWEQLYAGWERDDLKYYWQGHVREISPWEEKYQQPGRRIC